MAKRIIWTNNAKLDKVDILEYYYHRNKSKNYSKKLNTVFNTELNLISNFPYIGRATLTENVRIKVVGHYYLIYEINEDCIVVLRIWDSRQNPIKLRIFRD